MPRVTIDTSALDAFAAHLSTFAASLPQIMAQAVTAAGQNAADKFGSAAPQDPGHGPPPPGDANVALSQSFSSSLVPSDYGAYSASAVVRTSKPTTLQYVRFGTGLFGAYAAKIVPVVKLALYYQGADHPFAAAIGQEPNDFITPVIGEVLQDLLEIGAERVNLALLEVF